MESLSEATGLSIQEIRTSLKKLKSTNEIETKSTNRFTIINVLKWADYQYNPKDSNKQSTNNQQTINKQSTTNKNIKNIENIKNKELCKDYGEFSNVQLTDEEYEKIKSQSLTDYIDRLSTYLKSSGKKYKSHYTTILTWARKDGHGTNQQVPYQQGYLFQLQQYIKIH